MQHSELVAGGSSSSGGGGGAGRLVGARYQPAVRPRCSLKGVEEPGRPASAGLWVQVQPSKAAEVKPYWNAAEDGCWSAGFDSFVDWSRHSGAQAELEVGPGLAWTGAAGIDQR